MFILLRQLSQHACGVSVYQRRKLGALPNVMPVSLVQETPNVPHLHCLALATLSLAFTDRLLPSSLPRQEPDLDTQAATSVL